MRMLSREKVVVVTRKVFVAKDYVRELFVSFAWLRLHLRLIYSSQTEVHLHIESCLAAISILILLWTNHMVALRQIHS